MKLMILLDECEMRVMTKRIFKLAGGISPGMYVQVVSHLKYLLHIGKTFFSSRQTLLLGRFLQINVATAGFKICTRRILVCLFRVVHCMRADGRRARGELPSYQQAVPSKYLHTRATNKFNNATICEIKYKQHPTLFQQDCKVEVLIIL